MPCFILIASIVDKELIETDEVIVVILHLKIVSEHGRIQRTDSQAVNHLPPSIRQLNCHSRLEIDGIAPCARLLNPEAVIARDAQGFAAQANINQMPRLT